MKLETLKVGDVVAIGHYGRFRITSQGYYTVTKVTKVQVQLTRESDNYVRTFSVKTGYEKSHMINKYIDKDTFVESVATQDLREARLAAAREREKAWDNVAQAATRRSVSALKQALADLELLQEMA